MKTPEPQASVALVEVLLTPAEDRELNKKVSTLLYPGKGPRGHYLIIERSFRPDDPWSGHLALPGGRKENSDPNLWSTCLRELNEEVGLSLEREDKTQSSTAPILHLELPVVLARKSQKQRLPVQPFWIGLQKSDLPHLNLDPLEVNRSFWIPHSQLAQNENVTFNKISPYNSLSYPCLPVDNRFLWGFTYEVFRLFFAHFYGIQLPVEPQ